MAKRAKIEKFVTPVQGDDAWVEVTKPSVGEVEKILVAGDDVYQTFSVGKEILTKHVKGWNWVDYDDSPLPIPSVESKVVDELTLDEYQELIKLLLGAEEERKN